MPAEPHIGTLNEAHLHASLKELVAEPGDRFEVRVDTFVVDILRGDLIVEIQTRGFGAMKRKLRTLLPDRQIRLIHPIAYERWIVKLESNREDEQSRRKSPKKQGLEAVFQELVSVPDLINHPNLEIELVLVQEEELRYHDPKRAWRRKGWVVQERRLVDVLDRFVVRSHKDIFKMIGAPLPDEFTTADICDASGWNRRVAQQAAYCLRGCGAIEIVGKQGNALVYQKCRGRIKPPPLKSKTPPAATSTKKKKKKKAKKKISKKTSKKTTSKKTAKKRTGAASTTKKKKTAATRKKTGTKKTTRKKKTGR